MLIRPLLLLASIAGAFALEAVSKDVIVTNVDRSIDLASQLVKISSKLTVSNVGKSPIKSIHFTVDENAVDKVAFVGATVTVLAIFIISFFDTMSGSLAACQCPLYPQLV